MHAKMHRAIHYTDCFLNTKNQKIALQYTSARTPQKPEPQRTVQHKKSSYSQLEDLACTGWPFRFYDNHTEESTTVQCTPYLFSRTSLLR